jgi:hypothetical protein
MGHAVESFGMRWRRFGPVAHNADRRRGGASTAERSESPPLASGSARRPRAGPRLWVQAHPVRAVYFGVFWRVRFLSPCLAARSVMGHLPAKTGRRWHGAIAAWGGLACDTLDDELRGCANRIGSNRLQRASIPATAVWRQSELVQRNGDSPSAPKLHQPEHDGPRKD